MKEQDMSEPTNGTDSPTRSVGSYPMWKRGFAVMWVLVLCLASAVFGLVAAAVAGSIFEGPTISGY
jgi:hypothetical protein